MVDSTENEGRTARVTYGGEPTRAIFVLQSTKPSPCTRYPTLRRS